jgi:tetratricopeptide (TPR) repeat protein
MLLADYGSRSAMFDLAIAIVEEGVRQDPQIHDAAQTVHGYVHTKRGNWMAAAEAFEIAINSTVEYPPSQHYYSRLMAAVGRVDKSFEAAKSAWEMDPTDPVLNSQLAIACFWKNDIPCVRRYFEIANTMGLDAPIHQLSYALFLIRDNRLDEARDIARRAMTLYQIDASWVAPVFDELARSPNSESSLAVLQEYSARNAIPETALVIFWILAGQADRAMEMAWRLVDDPSLFELELIYLDEFRILRQHEDFPRLLDEIGLTEYWQSAGCEWEYDAVNCDST